jgi:adenylate cyclase
MSGRKGKQVRRKLLYAALCGFGAAALCVMLWFSGVLDAFEHATWGMRVRVFGKASEFTPRIKLILLDQDSLDWGAEVMSLSWPWPREMYAPVLQFLQRSETRAVGIDVLYTEPSAYGVEDDQTFGHSIGDSANVTAALFLGDETGALTNWPAEVDKPSLRVAGVDSARVALPQRERALFPIMEVATNAAVLGNVQESPERDGLFLRAAPITLFDGLAVPSLGAGLYLQDHGAARQASVRERTLWLGERSYPLDASGRFILNYRGSAQCYERYKMAAVIQSELRLQNGGDPVIDPEVFRDSYVLLGFSAPALMDQRATPVSSVTPGVFVHATLLDNLLAGDPVRDATLWAVLTILLLLSLGGALATLFTRRAWQNGVVYVVFGGLSIVIAAAAYPLGIWYPLTVQLLAVLLSVTAALLVHFATEGRQKMFIKKAFQHYLSGAVIERILDDPDRLTLGGERKELTIFFSDIQGFSTFSEKMEPQQLTSLLNEYLTDMTNIIFEEGGTLDKYEGDAIIAFWNAPLDQPDHALRACRAALRCRDRLDERRAELKQKYGAELYARIGMHTGEVVVGNMGSHERFDYTVLGDAANLASRLEGANKPFGTYLMISEETRKQVEGQISVCPIGKIRVVGRNKPVSVYLPLSTDPRAYAEEVARFKKGLEYVFSNDWKKALESFQSLETFPTVGKYVKRCEKLLAEGGDWDGIWNLTEK